MGKPLQPQPILTPLTEAAIFLVLTVDPGGEDAVRDLLADASGIRRSVGFRIPEGELTCVIGLGAQLWDRLFGEHEELLLALGSARHLPLRLESGPESLDIPLSLIHI